MDKLAPLINEVVEIIKQTKDFTIAQSPDFVRQYLIIQGIETVGWLLFSMVFLGAVVKFYLCFRSWWDEMNEIGCFFGVVAIVIGGFGSVFGIILNLTNLFEIWLAPKAYLVTSLIALANRHS